jgi:hypothetical protein
MAISELTSKPKKDTLRSTLLGLFRFLLFRVFLRVRLLGLGGNGI